MELKESEKTSQLMYIYRQIENDNIYLNAVFYIQFFISVVTLKTWWNFIYGLQLDSDKNFTTDFC